MRPAFVAVCGAILLTISAPRLPAPIVEEEKPTPGPEPLISQQKSKHFAKSKPKTEQSEASTKRSQRTPPTQAQKPENQSRCAGVWTGMLSFGILGAADETLTIDPTGTVVVEKNPFGSATHQATWDGATVRFQAGALNEVAFTLTPNADGQTAVVTANSMFISNPGAAFRKRPNSEGSATVTTSTASSQPNDIPTAKFVPGKPGFVYNPFDPNSRVLLDVRGKVSGTKLMEPRSGKLFFVP